MRCDFPAACIRFTWYGFNPHTYMRCDTLLHLHSIINSLFQSTHLHEVWQFIVLSFTYVPMFQSTHLHEVWLVFCWVVFCSHVVSIHTPTWGVTSLALLLTTSWNCFNPHTYMRCDPSISATILSTSLFQSTHLHEVWLFKLSSSMVNVTFQSTHLHEVWPSISATILSTSLFQSTHLHEVWLSWRSVWRERS